MDIQALALMLAGKFPIAGFVFAALGMLVIVGQAVVVMTPSKKDDEALEKAEAMPILGAVIKALAAFAPIQKK